MDLVGVAQGYVLLGFMCLCCDQWVPWNSATVHMPLCSGETTNHTSHPQQLLAGLADPTEMVVWLVRVDIQI